MYCWLQIIVSHLFGFDEIRCMYENLELFDSELIDFLENIDKRLIQDNYRFLYSNCNCNLKYDMNTNRFQYENKDDLYLFNIWVWME